MGHVIKKETSCHNIYSVICMMGHYQVNILVQKVIFFILIVQNDITLLIVN